MKSGMQSAFEAWYGADVGEDMDIQTSVAWENWQAAWKASARYGANLCLSLAKTSARTKGLRQHEKAFIAAMSEILQQLDGKE